MARRKSIGPCAKKCRGKTKGRFNKCVRTCMRK